MKFSKITISGLICTGKTTLFWGLQKKLNWTYFSASQFFRDYSRTHNMSLDKADEQTAKLTREIDDREYQLLSKNDHILIEGWMAGIMADRLPNVLKVLLICDESIRIKRFAKREKMALKEAKKRINARETNLFSKLSKIYNRADFLDKKYFNCIIDTTAITQEKLVERVIRQI